MCGLFLPLAPLLLLVLLIFSFAQAAAAAPRRRRPASIRFLYPSNEAPSDPQSKSSYPTIRTSSVRITLEVADLAFPEMHVVEVVLWRPAPNPDWTETDGPHVPRNVQETLMITSKMIEARGDAPGMENDEISKLIERKKADDLAKKRPDRDAVMQAVVDMTGMDPGDFEAEIDDILSPGGTHTVEFIARGLPSGRFGMDAQIKRRDIQSNVGIVLPPLVPDQLRTSQTFFVKTQVIDVSITHLNGVAIIKGGGAFGSPLFSSQSSILLNYTAVSSLDGVPFQIPKDGSLSVVVDGQPWRGPIVAPPDGTSVVLGMMSDGVHLVELAPVDAVEGAPIPESALGKAILFVNVRAPRLRVHINSPTPNEILDSDSDLWLDVEIVLEPLNNEGDKAAHDWQVGRDGYVRVQINNNTEERTFAHAGPYKISNLDTGVHTLEVLLVDKNFMPMTQRNGQATLHVVRFAYMVTEKEKKRRRRVEALQGEALTEALMGNGEAAENMIDVVRWQRGDDAPGGRNSDGASTMVDLGSSESAMLRPLIEGRTAGEERWSAENRPPGPPGGGM